MLQPEFMAVAQARTVDEFRSSVVRFTQDLGFKTVAATKVVDRPGAESEFIAVENTPPEFLPIFENPEFCRRDPVMQHCRTNALPIVWGQETYTKCGQGEKWEEQAKHGLRTGIALALHLPKGQHFLIGVDREQPLPFDPTERTAMVSHLHLFAVYAQEAASRLLTTDQKPEPLIRLTPRERDCLLWTMEGKTAWEIGQILSLSERTIAGTLGQAMRKLECVNKQQAVVKALRLGLLDLRH